MSEQPVVRLRGLSKHYGATRALSEVDLDIMPGTIVGVLCEPAGCIAFEAVAATTTGIGALVGIGLVVALATRSFDEYQESQRRGTPPTISSCGVDDRLDNDSG